MKKHILTDRGFTLLESMIALIVLATGLLGLTQLFVLAIHQNSYGRQNTLAVSAAVDKLESFKSQYNRYLATNVLSPDLANGIHGPVDIEVAGAPQTNAGPYRYSVSWTVGNTGREKDVVVTVAPKSANIRENRPVQLTAHMSP